MRQTARPSSGGNVSFSATRFFASSATPIQRKQLELSRLPTSPAVRSLRLKRSSPGTTANFFPPFKTRYLDPGHPATKLHPKEFPVYRGPLFGLRTYPFASLQPPEEAIRPLSYVDYSKRTRSFFADEARIIPMAMACLIGKKAVHNSAVVRNRIRARMKEALRLVVARGARVVEDGTISVHPEDAGEAQWLAPEWIYVFQPTLEMYRHPMPGVITAVRTALHTLKKSQDPLSLEWSITEEIAKNTRAEEEEMATQAWLQEHIETPHTSQAMQRKDPVSSSPPQEPTTPNLLKSAPRVLVLKPRAPHSRRPYSTYPHVLSPHHAKIADSTTLENADPSTSSNPSPTNQAITDASQFTSSSSSLSSLPLSERLRRNSTPSPLTSSPHSPLAPIILPMPNPPHSPSAHLATPSSLGVGVSHRVYPIPGRPMYANLLASIERLNAARSRLDWDTEEIIGLDSYREVTSLSHPSHEPEVIDFSPSTHEWIEASTTVASIDESDSLYLTHEEMYDALSRAYPHFFPPSSSSKTFRIPLSAGGDNTVSAEQVMFWKEEADKVERMSEGLKAEAARLSKIWREKEDKLKFIAKRMKKRNRSTGYAWFEAKATAYRDRKGNDDSGEMKGDAGDKKV